MWHRVQAHQPPSTPDLNFHHRQSPKAPCDERTARQTDAPTTQERASRLTGAHALTGREVACQHPPPSILSLGSHHPIAAIHSRR